MKKLFIILSLLLVTVLLTSCISQEDFQNAKNDSYSSGYDEGYSAGKDAQSDFEQLSNPVDNIGETVLFPAYLVLRKDFEDITKISAYTLYDPNEVNNILILGWFDYGTIPDLDDAQSNDNIYLWGKIVGTEEDEGIICPVIRIYDGWITAKYPGE